MAQKTIPQLATDVSKTFVASKYKNAEQGPTRAFLENLLDSVKSRLLRTSVVVANYTLAAADNGTVVLVNNGANACSVTVPVALGAGFNCEIVALGAGVVTLVTSAVTANSVSGNHAKISAQFGRVGLIAYSANSFILSGDIAAL